jgi:hypothetical protein
MGHVALEVPLPPLAVGRRGERDHPGVAGVERLGDALDRPALAGGVAAFEDQHHPETPGPDELLLLDQFDLQPDQLALVVLGAHACGRPWNLLDRRLLLGSRHGGSVLRASRRINASAPGRQDTGKPDTFLA